MLFSKIAIIAKICGCFSTPITPIVYTTDSEYHLSPLFTCICYVALAFCISILLYLNDSVILAIKNKYFLLQTFTCQVETTITTLPEGIHLGAAMSNQQRSNTDSHFISVADDHQYEVNENDLMQLRKGRWLNDKVRYTTIEKLCIYMILILLPLKIMSGYLRLLQEAAEKVGSVDSNSLASYNK